jgi:hypothetical protein
MCFSLFPRLDDAQPFVRFIYFNDRITYAASVEKIYEKVLEVRRFVLVKSGRGKNKCHYILTEARS